MADELDETYNGPAPVVVVPAEPVEREIDAALEFEAAEAIVNEENHEEVMTCLHNLTQSSTQQAESLRSLAEHQTESPMLLQIQEQQSRILEGQEKLLRMLSTESKPKPPSSSESPRSPEENSERTEVQIDEPAPAAEPPRREPAPRRRRFQLI